MCKGIDVHLQLIVKRKQESMDNIKDEPDIETSGISRRRKKKNCKTKMAFGDQTNQQENNTQCDMERVWSIHSPGNYVYMKRSY